MIVYPKQRKTDMDKIEKIRQEIERRKVQYYEREMKAWDDNGEYGDEDCYFYQGKRRACEGLLSFLDTLSEEPDNEDLNDEIKKFIEEYEYERGEDKLLIAIVARHFAEWQKQQMMDEWLKDRDGCFWDGVNEGKKAMEEQLTPQTRHEDRRKKND